MNDIMRAIEKLGSAVKPLLELDDRPHLIGFELKVRVDEIPTIKVELEIRDDVKANDFVSVFKCYRLVLLDE